jgi:hypothetical protein
MTPTLTAPLCRHGARQAECQPCHREGAIRDAAQRRREAIHDGHPADAKPVDPVSLPLHQVVLLAAGQLGEEFGRTALVVAAWKLDPQRLGLEGLETHMADSKHVLQWLYGPLGLLTRGFMQRRAAKTYALTALGRREVERLTHGGTRNGITPGPGSAD